MRLLLFMAHGGFTRNFESTLRELDARGHEVRVAVDRPASDGLARLCDLADELEGLSIEPAPASGPADWARVGQHLRSGLDFLRFLDPAYAAAEGPRRRAAALVPTPIVAISRWGLARGAMKWLLLAAERARPLEPAFARFVADRAPDVVALTPLVELGSPQLEHRRAARQAGAPVALCVASWDNLGMRGGIHDLPDLVAVWNERQREEATALHGVPAERTVVTGAGAFDHWFDWEPGRPAQALRAELGLPPDSAHLLYVGSSLFIAPEEGSFVRQWIEQVRQDPLLRHLGVVVRPHPLNPFSDPDRRSIAALEGVAVQEPTAGGPVRTAERSDYFDAIFHSVAVIGINTSAFVESAVVGRPTYTVLSDRYRRGQEGTLHFAHLLPAGGGVLHAARSWSEHRAALVEAVRTPDRTVAATRRWAQAFVRPGGLEGSAASRLVDELERLQRDPRPVPALRPTVVGRLLAHAARFALVLHGRWSRS